MGIATFIADERPVLVNVNEHTIGEIRARLGIDLETQSGLAAAVCDIDTFREVMNTVCRETRFEWGDDLKFEAAIGTSFDEGCMALIAAIRDKPRETKSEPSEPPLRASQTGGRIVPLPGQSINAPLYLYANERTAFDDES
jgi:hypothetical protein